MAYRDGSGAITIDEVAAANDIRRIQEAESYLAQSRAAIIRLMDLADSMTGQTSDAIRDKAYELQILVDRLSSQLVQSRQLISATVRRYQQIDAEIARQIASQAAKSSVGIDSGHTGTNVQTNMDGLVGILGGVLGGGSSGNGSSGGGGRSF